MPILTAPRSSVRPQSIVPRYTSWQDAMKDAIRDPAELCRTLDLPDELVAGAAAASGPFPLFVPRGYAARMRPGDPADPLLRQVLPLGEELDDVPGFVADPVDDAAATRQPGLLQKYAGRVLLLATGSCAVHCRYCFRRHFPYAESPRRLADWEPALGAIANDQSIHEVILSGGDPLTIVDNTLAELVEAVAEIPHIRRLRIHTRLPIVIPERVTESFVQLLRCLRQASVTPIVVLHANHANELDAHVAATLAKLVDAGIMLLNQAVLLHGVNDSADAQAALCERLVELGVMPYYLHQLDRVAGAAHFEVPIAKGRQIVDQLRASLPGYAVPRYAAEVPGMKSKSILA